MNRIEKLLLISMGALALSQSYVPKVVACDSGQEWYDDTLSNTSGCRPAENYGPDNNDNNDNNDNDNNDNNDNNNNDPLTNTGAPGPCGSPGPGQGIISSLAGTNDKLVQNSHEQWAYHCQDDNTYQSTDQYSCTLVNSSGQALRSWTEYVYKGAYTTRTMCPSDADTPDQVTHYP